MNTLDNSLEIYIVSSQHKCFEDYYDSLKVKLNINIFIYDELTEDVKNNIIKIINNKKNIIIIPYLIPSFLENNIKYTNVFFLNTEQLTNQVRLNYIKEKVKNKFHIIDYSRENIDILNNNNVSEVIYFPYIYNKSEIYEINKTKDICSITPKNKIRRRRTHHNLTVNHKIAISEISGWKEERDVELFKHKILLNISAHVNYNIFESIRCNRCLFNKMIIISEKKYKTELIDYAKHILFVELSEMPNLIKDVINNYEHYYKLLDLDNVDYHLNDNLINSDILWKYVKNA